MGSFGRPSPLGGPEPSGCLPRNRTFTESLCSSIWRWMNFWRRATRSDLSGMADDDARRTEQLVADCVAFGQHGGNGSVERGIFDRDHRHCFVTCGVERLTL